MQTYVPLVTSSRSRGLSARKVVLVLADELAARLPALQLGSPPLLAQLQQRRPVDRVVVLELELAVAELGGELLLGHVLAHVLVELELLARQGVDEGGDELEEAPDDPGD